MNASEPLVSLNLILVYIGKLPNYFPLFLRSCATNPSIQWSLLTSSPVEYELPQNVRQVRFDLDDFHHRVEHAIGVRPDIGRPYKLCDFKPAYGLLYPELFEGFDFWGHCDADVIFGDLRKFYPDSAFANQVKVQMRGSLSFYRNNEEGNRLFQLPHPQIDHRKVLSNPKNCCFDEWEGLYKLMKVNQVGFWLSNDLAEIAVCRRDLRLAHRKNYPKQLFTWEDGKILRTAWENGEEIADEYAYIHLQKRPISRVEVSEGADFAFLPGEIVTLRASAEKVFLADRNRRDRLWELRYHVDRVRRYWHSLKTIDRRYWRVPK